MGVLSNFSGGSHLRSQQPNTVRTYVYDTHDKMIMHPPRQTSAMADCYVSRTSFTRGTVFGVFFFFLLFMKTSLRTAVDEKKNHQTEGLFPDLARN